MSKTSTTQGKVLFRLTAGIIGCSLFWSEFTGFIHHGQHWLATLLWIFLKGYIFWRFVTARKWALNLARTAIVLMLISCLISFCSLAFQTPMPSRDSVLIAVALLAVLLFLGWTLFLSRSVHDYLSSLIHRPPALPMSWGAKGLTYGRRLLLVCMALSLMLYDMMVGSTTETPSVPPPIKASNVHFYEWQAWQSWDFVYRFDAPPDVCERFATELMKRQSRGDESFVPSKEKFTKFPLGFGSNRKWTAWFDVDSVKNGVLLTYKKDWGPYAVVDQDRGRLYYYNGN